MIGIEHIFPDRVNIVKLVYIHWTVVNICGEFGVVRKIFNDELKDSWL
jgi:hypothetical protein